MKPKFILYPSSFILATLCLCALVVSMTGCKTTANPSGVVQVGGVTLDPVATGHAVQAAAKLGGLAAIRQQPASRDYFLWASVGINAAIASGNVTPDDVKAALASVTQDQFVNEAVADAVQLYADFYGQLVAGKLDGKSPYTIPVLTGLAAGLKQAYDLTAP
jgi:hypothetical protein